MLQLEVNCIAAPWSLCSVWMREWRLRQGPGISLCQQYFHALVHNQWQHSTLNAVNWLIAVCATCSFIGFCLLVMQQKLKGFQQCLTQPMESEWRGLLQRRSSRTNDVRSPTLHTISLQHEKTTQEHTDIAKPHCWWTERRALDCDAKIRFDLGGIFLNQDSLQLTCSWPG